MLCALLCLACVAGCGSSAPGRARRAARAASEEHIRRTWVLGRSVDGRAITAIETGDPDSPAHSLVVGCIHGNEPAGIAIAEGACPPGSAELRPDLWVIADLNPDGVAADTRGNAHTVDLNRNFPYRWAPLGAPGSTYYSGPHALSEPEGKLVAALVRRLRPRLTIYYHQHLDVVDDSQGPRQIERRYAHAAHLPLHPLSDYPGSAVGWQDHLLGPTAFMVELPAGALSNQRVDAHVDALMAVAPRA